MKFNPRVRSSALNHSKTRELNRELSLSSYAYAPVQQFLLGFLLIAATHRRESNIYIYIYGRITYELLELTTGAISFHESGRAWELNRVASNAGRARVSDYSIRVTISTLSDFVHRLAILKREKMIFKNDSIWISKRLLDRAFAFDTF